MPKMNEDSLREKLYEIMYEFCKYCYHRTNPYLNTIIDFTIAHMQLRN